MHRRALALSALVLAVALAQRPAPACAAWSVNGNALSLAPQVQSAPQAASDGHGGAYVVWLDNRAGNTDLYAQHVTSSGTIAGGWAADGNAVCADPSTQGPPRIVADGQGNAYVAWHDSRGSFDVFVQKLLPGGVAPGWPASGLAVCGAANAQINPVLIADAAGALVAWSDTRGASEDVYVQHVLAAGTVDPSWPVNGAILAGANQQQAFPSIVSDGAGGAIVVWEDGRNGGAITTQLDIYAGHMKSTGAADSTWGNNGALVCLSPGFDQGKPIAVPVPGGGAIFVWLDRRNGDGDLYARRIAGDGTFPAGWPADGNEVAHVVGEQTAPVAIADGSGGVIVAWQDGRDTSSFPTNTDVFAVRLLGNGARAAGWAANGNDLSVQPDRQDAPAMCSDGLGGALIAWKDGRPGAEIYAQHVQPDGSRAAGWAADGLPLCTAVEQQVAPTLVSDGAFGGVCAWEDYRNSIATHDIYGLRFNGSGQPPNVGVGDARGGRLGLGFAGANPSRGTARFAVALPVAGRASAAVYSPAGRRVATLWADAPQAAGPHVLSWDATAAPPGMYVLEVVAGDLRSALRFVSLP
jgi:hypothetical protein